MNEQMFEQKMLGGQITINEYIEQGLKNDIIVYYKLKLFTEIVYRNCLHSLDSALFPPKKNRLREIVSRIRSIKVLMYECKFDFNFAEHTTNRDFDLLLNLIGSDQARFTNAVL